MWCKRTAGLFVAGVPSQRGLQRCSPCFCRAEAIGSHPKVKPIASLLNPAIPLGPTTISGLIFVKRLKHFPVRALAKPRTIQSRILQDSSDVIQAINHIADQR